MGTKELTSILKMASINPSQIDPNDRNLNVGDDFNGGIVQLVAAQYRLKIWINRLN